jgi:uncharacterized membrane protein YeaQ/YmgE (transglycosylase-associated protein family)
MTLEGIALTLAIGFATGLVARAVVPGRQNFGLIATIGLGLAGSVVGSLLVGVLRHERVELALGGWWASIVGAIIVLGLVVALSGGGRRVR